MRIMIIIPVRMPILFSSLMILGYWTVDVVAGGAVFGVVCGLIGAVVFGTLAIACCGNPAPACLCLILLFLL